MTHTNRVFIRKVHKLARNIKKHYTALVILAVAVLVILWILGFGEFTHSLAFLVFEHVLRHTTGWLAAAEE